MARKQEGPKYTSWQDVKDSNAEDNPDMNFRVVSLVRSWKEMAYVEKAQRAVPVEMSERRATHLNLRIRGQRLNDKADMVDHDFSHTPELPFTTFDNPWVGAGEATPEQVARAVFQSPAFGVSVQLIPMNADEVRNYNAMKTSPAVQEARERAANVDTGAILNEQERLLRGGGLEEFAPQRDLGLGTSRIFGTNPSVTLPPVPA